MRDLAAGTFSFLDVKRNEELDSLHRLGTRGFVVMDIDRGEYVITEAGRQAMREEARRGRVPAPWLPLFRGERA